MARAGNHLAFFTFIFLLARGRIIGEKCTPESWVFFFFWRTAGRLLLPMHN